MQWFWDAYTTDPAQRAEITASPNQASTEQVTGLPPTYLCVDELGGVRFFLVHDFMLLNALSETRATRAAHRPGHRFPTRRARNHLARQRPRSARHLGVASSGDG